MKVSNTIFDGTFFHYTCAYCNVTTKEIADPAKNPNPFDFMPRCTSCGVPKEPDIDVIENAHAALCSGK